MAFPSEEEIYIHTQSDYQPMRERKANTTLSRRQFLFAASQLALGLWVSSPLKAFSTPYNNQELSFLNIHTREKLTICYAPGACSLGTQEQIDILFRDFRTGEMYPTDPGLLDTLYCIQQQVKSQGVFEVISGYRSPKTNQYLRRISTGVAKNSLHMKGRAIDVRLNGLPTHLLRDIATQLRHGGVGYYAKSDFVHLDTGPFRTW